MHERSFVWVAATAVVLTLAAGPALTDSRTFVVRGAHYHEGAGYLGVSAVEAVDYPEGGARVTSVVEGSPAEAAGLRHDDIIVGVDGRAVRGPMALTSRIREREAGERIELTVVRDGREIALDAELGDLGQVISDRVRTNLRGLQLHLDDLDEGLEGLRLESLGNLEHLGALDFDSDFDFSPFDDFGERFEDFGRSFENFGEQFEHIGRMFIEHCENGNCSGFTYRADRPMLGVGLTETTPELRRHLGGDDEAGALVERVVAGSAAEQAGIAVGDLIVAIDGKPVKGSWDIRRALADRAGQRVRVDVVRDGVPLTIDVDLPEADSEDGRRLRPARGSRT